MGFSHNVVQQMRPVIQPFHMVWFQFMLWRRKKMGYSSENVEMGESCHLLGVICITWDTDSPTLSWSPPAEWIQGRLHMCHKTCCSSAKACAANRVLRQHWSCACQQELVLCWIVERQRDGEMGQGRGVSGCGRGSSGSEGSGDGNREFWTTLKKTHAIWSMWLIGPTKGTRYIEPHQVEDTEASL